MKVLTRKNQLLKLIKRYKESLLVEYSLDTGKTLQGRLTHVQLTGDKKNIELEVKNLKERYELKQQVLLRDVTASVNFRDREQLVDVTFFTFYGF